MSSYVQLGRGFRGSYGTASFRPQRRRAGGKGVAVTLGLAAAVFAAGILMGSLEAESSHSLPNAPHPMQFYPR